MGGCQLLFRRMRRPAEIQEKTRYEFRDSTIVANAREAAKFRTTESELKNVAIGPEFKRSGDQLSIDVRIGDNFADRVSTFAANDVIRGEIPGVRVTPPATSRRM